MHVLIIDDDPEAFALVQHMLLAGRALDYAVDWVDSYDRGLAALQEDRYDVYLIDYLLGNEDGISLLQHANELGLQTPIIILTAYGTYHVDVEVMHLGAMDFIDKKQITPELLERSIRYAVERKKTERELKRLNEHIHALEQLKTDMIRLAAHDLKNPLATILLNARVVKDLIARQDWPRLEAAIQQVEDSASTMKNIISSILSLERIEELATSSLHKFELKGAVESVVQRCAGQAEEKAQTLSVQLPQVPVPVYGNHVLLTQAIANLLDNAITHTSRGTHITVRLTVEGSEAVFEVEDDGCGIAPEYHERIFQAFFRLAADGDTADGTGLGLHLVKSTVVRHRGAIIFRSMPGEGSTFGFRLPVFVHPLQA